MSRVLCVGDLHTKADLLPLIEDTIELTDPDYIVLMGDYMDDWHVPPQENLNSLRALYEWARGYDNLTMLFGNHDMAYYSLSGACAGNAPVLLNSAPSIFHENRDITCVAIAFDNWLFSHAGLCTKWAAEYLDAPQTACEASTQMNALLEDGRGNVRRELESVGYARGGWKRPGPLDAADRYANR